MVVRDAERRYPPLIQKLKGTAEDRRMIRKKEKKTGGHSESWQGREAGTVPVHLCACVRACACACVDASGWRAGALRSGK